jgi:hypothetical protein
MDGRTVMHKQMAQSDRNQLNIIISTCDAQMNGYGKC